MHPERAENLQDVAACTAALASDPSFEASDRLKRLLAYLGQHAAEDRKVTQGDIARDVMELGSDFDPQFDAHVRIEVGRLRKAVELYYARGGNSENGRIVIPKGSYRPEIEVVSNITLVETGPEIANDSIAVFVGLASSSELPADLANLASGELRAHCFTSPLTSARLMHFNVRSVDQFDDARRLAVENDNDLALCIQIYNVENETRILLDLERVDTGGVLLSKRLAFNNETNTPQLARKIARGIANILCDPIFGAVPNIASREWGLRDLAIVLSAYRFMATQKVEMIPDIVAGLQHIATRPDAAPPLKALLSEISRVNSWITGKDVRGDAYRCLALAEEAIGEDPSDITCRIALGYNRLNAGLIEAALHTGTTILSSPAPTSLVHMSRMLVAVADTEGLHRERITHLPFDDETPFFMKEFAEVVPMIRWSENQEAERVLANSLFPNVFWLHIFHSAVLAEIKDRKRSALCVNRLRQLLPDCESRLKNMILGVFPKENEAAYLFNGLRQSGLKLN